MILGTILAISAVVEEYGWTLEAGLIAFGGTALAFGMWWVYFVVPAGPVLARHPLRGFPWGYGHIFLFGSVIAVGSGLHIAAQVIAGHSEVDEMFAVVAVAIPVLAFELMLVRPLRGPGDAVRPAPPLALPRVCRGARPRGAGGQGSARPSAGRS